MLGLLALWSNSLLRTWQMLMHEKNMFGTNIWLLTDITFSVFLQTFGIKITGPVSCPSKFLIIQVYTDGTDL